MYTYEMEYAVRGRHACLLTPMGVSIRLLDAFPPRVPVAQEQHKLRHLLHHLPLVGCGFNIV